MGRSERRGKCKLTECDGAFIKAHLIPEALTETTWKGQPLTQMGRHGRPIKRWTSWYDDSLVTIGGENILTSYDTWAIEFFRAHNMIWSSWGEEETLDVPDHTVDPFGSSGLRQLLNIDGARLRLFLLSLLWRAVATSMFEFDAVRLPPDHLEALRLVVRDGAQARSGFFPVTLVQLSTRNFPHNLSPSRLVKREPMCEPSIAMANGLYRDVPIFRFFFDVLTAQFHIKETEQYVQARARSFVGEAKDLFVVTVPSERSGAIARFWLADGDVPPQEHTRGSWRI